MCIFTASANREQHRASHTGVILSHTVDFTDSKLKVLTPNLNLNQGDMNLDTNSWTPDIAAK